MFKKALSEEPNRSDLRIIFKRLCPVGVPPHLEVRAAWVNVGVQPNMTDKQLSKTQPADKNTTKRHNREPTHQHNNTVHSAHIPLQDIAYEYLPFQ